jgi:hypothetical protein
MKYVRSIDTVIKDAEAISLSDLDILNITDNKCKVMRYKDLEGYKTIDQALGPHGAAVILYQHEEDFGHWVAVFIVDETTIEVFDSYGIPIDSEIEFSPFQLRRHKGKVPHLTHLIENSPHYTTVLENKEPLQKDKKDVNTCGRWAAVRIRFRDVPLKDFDRMFRNTSCGDADFTVSALTLLFS